MAVTEEKEKGVGREGTYLYAWSNGTVMLDGTRQYSRGSLCNDLAMKLGVGSRRAQDLVNMLVGWKDRVKTDRDLLTLKVDPSQPEKVLGRSVSAPKTETNWKSCPKDPVLLKYLRHVSSRVSFRGREVMRVVNPIPKLHGKFRAATGELEAALLRLSTEGVLELTADEQRNDIVILLSQTAQSVPPCEEVVTEEDEMEEPEATAAVEVPRVVVEQAVPPTQIAEKRRQVAFLLPHEMRILGRIRMQYPSMFTHPEQKPWDVSQSPLIELKAHQFAAHFGPTTFADAMVRFMLAGVLVQAEGGMYRFGKHPAFMRFVATSQRYVCEHTSIERMRLVQEIRNDLRADTRAELDTWFARREAGSTTRLYGYLPDTNPPPAGPIGLIVLYDHHYWMSVNGLTAVDFIASQDPNRKKGSYSVRPLPEDAALSLLDTPPATTETVPETEVLPEAQAEEMPPVVEAKTEEPEPDVVESEELKASEGAEVEVVTEATEVKVSESAVVSQPVTVEEERPSASTPRVYTVADVEATIARKCDEEQRVESETNELMARLQMLQARSGILRKEMSELEDLKKKMEEAQEAARKLLG